MIPIASIHVTSTTSGRCPFRILVRRVGFWIVNKPVAGRARGLRPHPETMWPHQPQKWRKIWHNLLIILNGQISFNLPINLRGLHFHGTGMVVSRFYRSLLQFFIARNRPEHLHLLKVEIFRGFHRLLEVDRGFCPIFSPFSCKCNFTSLLLYCQNAYKYNTNSLKISWGIRPLTPPVQKARLRPC